MASAFKRKGEKIWIASYQDQYGRWRQKRGRASRAETKSLAKRLEDDARRKRLVADTKGVACNQSIESAIEDYERYLSQIRKGSRQVKQAKSRLLRVFRAARIRRMEEISADAIHEAVGNFESEKGREA
jgi:hypothetical protein